MACTCIAVLFLLAYTFCAANCNLNSQELDQLLGSEVRKTVFLEEPMNIKILAAGKVGVGKSLIISALVGMDIAKTDDDVMSVTKEVKTTVVAKNNVHVYITGFEDLYIEDDNTIHEGLEHEDVDLLLFCMKMTERLDRYHIEEIRAITNTFGEDVWRKGLFVLTFANEFIENGHFTSKLHEWENEIRKRIKNMISVEVAEEIPIVPTGFKEPQLPDRPSWVSELWIQGIRRMNFKARLYMAVLNVERIEGEMDGSKLLEEIYANPEKQPLVTCYMWKKESKYTVPKHNIRGICQTFCIVTLLLSIFTTSCICYCIYRKINSSISSIEGIMWLIHNI